MNENAQIHTIEGFTAAILMTLTVMLVTQSSFIITPQSELAMDVQLKQAASNVLAVLDMAPDSAYPLNLTEHVAGWNMTEATPQANSLPALNTEIGKLLKDVMYNVDFAYAENGIVVKHAIINGAPSESSVVATRLVTLQNSTLTNAWNISPGNIKVVEVRLIAWHV